MIRCWVFLGEVIPDLFRAVDAVQQECAVLGGILEHIQLLHEGELVAGDEVGGVDQIGGADLVGAEAEMRNRNTSGLLGVVDEIPLGVVLRVIPDDFDGVLVGPHSAVGAEAEEETPGGLGIRGGEVGIVVQAHMGDVVVNSHGETLLGFSLPSSSKTAFTMVGGELLGGETVPTADDADTAAIFPKGTGHIKEEGFSVRSGLLGTIQHRHGLHGFRKGLEQMLRREGAVEANLDDSHLFALSHQIVHCLVSGLGTGAHENDNLLCIRSAHVVEETVFPGPPPW